MRPLYHAGVIVWVRDGDSRDPAQRAHGVDGGAVEEADAVPQDVSTGSLEEQRALTDGEARVGADPRQVGFLGHDLVVMVPAHLLERGPALAVPAHVLALIAADWTAL